MRSVKKYINLMIILTTALNFGLSANAQEYKFNMSYIYYGNADYYAQLVSNTQNSLNEVSPDYFSLNANGDLVLTPDFSASFIKNMHDGASSSRPT